MPVGSDCTSGDTEPDPDKGVKLSQGEEAHARLRVPKLAAQTDRDSNDFEGRFRRHFPRRSNDFALVVLKGHLLMEESVNRLLAALLYRPEAIEGANLRFHQKLCLIRALAPVGPNGVVFRFADAAEKLNTMRNRLAHLNYPQRRRRRISCLCAKTRRKRTIPRQRPCRSSAVSGVRLSLSAPRLKE